MLRTQKPCDVGVAGLPDLSSADGGCDTSVLSSTAVSLQATSAAAPRRVYKPVYLLRLQARSDVDDIRALRWALKKLLRLGLRCVSIEVRR
jgi:hypothetical protein